MDALRNYFEGLNGILIIVSLAGIVVVILNHVGRKLSDGAKRLWAEFEELLDNSDDDDFFGGGGTGWAY